MKGLAREKLAEMTVLAGEIFMWLAAQATISKQGFGVQLLDLETVVIRFEWKQGDSVKSIAHAEADYKFWAGNPFYIASLKKRLIDQIAASIQESDRGVAS